REIQTDIRRCEAQVRREKQPKRLERLRSLVGRALPASVDLLGGQERRCRGKAVLDGELPPGRESQHCLCSRARCCLIIQERAILLLSRAEELQRLSSGRRNDVGIRDSREIP